ncbi:putative inner membrane protein [Gimesia maris]|uniref:YeeE/YedE thiosulfate transporter family protein n=1 Tax=Gimesia maris TaxID=122 RepID=UPI00118C0D92|nr:YeeE/YedE thiosulfate transporter family protein [Gimesia maris]QDT77549.1 putative inner membrane protein [Gimesia maris]
MNNLFQEKSWPPYLVGAGIGILSWFAFLTADHPLGITTAFEHTAALIEKYAAPALAERNSYFEKESPKIGWEWMLVAGVFIGSFISSKASGDRNAPAVPPLWQQRFGTSKSKRYAAAFIGGTLMLFGARMAQGCTSGHGISGTLQLAASSWLFTAIFFSTSIGTAFLLYGREGRKNV